ncbi:hypothetical protein ACEQUB_00464 [Ralstonia syzygii]
MPLWHCAPQPARCRRGAAALSRYRVPACARLRSWFPWTGCPGRGAWGRRRAGSVAPRRRRPYRRRFPGFARMHGMTAGWDAPCGCGGGRVRCAAVLRVGSAIGGQGGAGSLRRDADLWHDCMGLPTSEPGTCWVGRRYVQRAWPRCCGRSTVCLARSADSPRMALPWAGLLDWCLPRSGSHCAWTGDKAACRLSPTAGVRRSAATNR